jgi:hypothetical protein
MIGQNNNVNNESSWVKIEMMFGTSKKLGTKKNNTYTIKIIPGIIYEPR